MDFIIEGQTKTIANRGKRASGGIGFCGFQRTLMCFTGQRNGGGSKLRTLSKDDGIAVTRIGRPAR